MADVGVRDVRFVAADASHRREGLLGWVSCVIGDLAIDGLAVRRTLDARLALSFPARRGHPVVRPVTDETRQAIEREVLEAIGMTTRGM